MQRGLVGSEMCIRDRYLDQLKIIKAFFGDADISNIVMNNMEDSSILFCNRYYPMKMIKPTKAKFGNPIPGYKMTFAIAYYMPGYFPQLRIVEEDELTFLFKPEVPYPSDWMTKRSKKFYVIKAFYYTTDFTDTIQNHIDAGNTIIPIDGSLMPDVKFGTLKTFVILYHRRYPPAFRAKCVHDGQSMTID
eukprot:TRINITY_DN1153_c0_g1_i2.p2 TRINITY_DN1153_c0_g1~~TRINITY_DN1153_c0_g1_i2.p2  ORF type:complete len:190 (+),score=29.28 TRINITY_DN1153_c0_g1_i2:139-708(+)